MNDVYMVKPVCSSQIGNNQDQSKNDVGKLIRANPASLAVRWDSWGWYRSLSSFTLNLTTIALGTIWASTWTWKLCISDKCTRSVSHDLKRTIPQNQGQTPQTLPTLLENEFEPASLLHHHSFLAQLFSVGLFFLKYTNNFKHLLKLSLDGFAIKFESFWAFLAKITPFSLSGLCLSLDYSRDNLQ